MMTFAWQQAAAEQGDTVAVVAKVEHETEWTGTAEATLAGLPPHATAQPVTITPDTEEVVFTVTVDEKTPPGTHKSVHALVTVPWGTVPEGEQPAEKPDQLALAEEPETTSPDEQEPSETAVGAADDAAKDETGETTEEAAPEPVADARPTVLHMFRGGILRVDKPIVKKETAKTPEAEKKNAPPKPKPLSRLEQLRRAKAGQ